MMETKQIQIDDFMESRKKRILEIAEENTKAIVEKELALVDFELLLATHLSEKNITKLEKESKKLRIENWKELEKRFNGDYNKINEFLNSL